MSKNVPPEIIGFIIPLTPESEIRVELLMNVTNRTCRALRVNVFQSYNSMCAIYHGFQTQNRVRRTIPPICTISSCALILPEFRQTR